MLEHTGKVKKHRNGRLCYAEVTIQLAERTSDPSPITFHLSGKGFTSQGDIEEVPAHGYLEWRQGAELGINFAIATAHSLGELRQAPQLIVTRILGLSTDTTPSMVAAAAAYAAWKGFAHTPAREDLELLDRLVLASLQQPLDWVPASL